MKTIHQYFAIAMAIGAGSWIGLDLMPRVAGLVAGHVNRGAAKLIAMIIRVCRPHAARLKAAILERSGAGKLAAKIPGMKTRRKKAKDAKLLEQIANEADSHEIAETETQPVRLQR